MVRVAISVLRISLKLCPFAQGSPTAVNNPKASFPVGRTLSFWWIDVVIGGWASLDSGIASLHADRVWRYTCATPRIIDRASSATQSVTIKASSTCSVGNSSIDDRCVDDSLSPRGTSSRRDELASHRRQLNVDA